ncbi:hypothetical protein J169_04114 [Xanthomonas citri pv. citri]|nr:hypothetical protein J151_04117 [Xanthomonas citri subsp. citri A306]AJY92896.1 hypothetical protein J169_04114 [Xanthomonas citri pv. citri]CAE6832993.1 hypothetical protein XA1311A_36640 [Xanthomonas arboricola]AJZ10636.1 hypothetical protein J172_04107 [Xanthomonas citri pv. citri]AJZ32804.1 hypothetical protein J171_04109 [Xanthomonas citri pv. citri]
MLIGTMFTSFGLPSILLLRMMTGRFLIISPCKYSDGNSHMKISPGLGW